MSKHIHNEFATWLKELKSDIGVSDLRNLCSHLTGSVHLAKSHRLQMDGLPTILGMTAHWIEVKDSKWKMQSEVIGFQGISGEHSGWNLGHYFIGLCNHVGICENDKSNVCHLILDIY